MQLREGFLRSAFLSTQSTGNPNTLLPDLTEAAPKDLPAQTFIDFGQVAKSIIDHLGTIHGLIDFVLALP